MAKLLLKTMLFFVLLLFLVAWGGFWVRDNIKDFSSASLINILRGQEKVELSDEEKNTLKDKVREAKYKVYEEATEHNPEGDLLPDEIDDKLKEKIKEEAQKRVE